MKRSQQKSQRALYILSLLVALSMVCSTIFFVIDRPSAEPTTTPTWTPFPTIAVATATPAQPAAVTVAPPAAPAPATATPTATPTKVGAAGSGAMRQGWI